MGAFKGSCEIDFSVRDSFALNSFVAPEALLESLQADGSRTADDVLAECRQRFVGDAGVNENALRLVNLEGTSERDAVEVPHARKPFSSHPWHNLQRFRHGSTDPIPASQRQLGAERKRR